MLVYRLAKEKHIRDLGGTGALYGPGRWHEQGTRVLYTAETFSLAKLEVLANSKIIPRGFSLILIEIPDDVSVKELTVDDLPDNWNAFPHPKELKALAEEWVSEGKHLVLKVPSAHSPFERNYLINPLHPEHGRLRIVETRTHVFDERLKPEEPAEPDPREAAAAPKARKTGPGPKGKG